jgi:AAA15 family ATPase/GTPase
MHKIMSTISLLIIIAIFIQTAQAQPDEKSQSPNEERAVQIDRQQALLMECKQMFQQITARLEEIDRQQALRMECEQMFQQITARLEEVELMYNNVLAIIHDITQLINGSPIPGELRQLAENIDVNLIINVMRATRVQMTEMGERLSRIKNMQNEQQNRNMVVNQTQTLLQEVLELCLRMRLDAARIRNFVEGLTRQYQELQQRGVIEQEHLRELQELLNLQTLARQENQERQPLQLEINLQQQLMYLERQEREVRTVLEADENRERYNLENNRLQQNLFANNVAAEVTSRIALPATSPPVTVHNTDRELVRLERELMELIAEPEAPAHPLVQEPVPPVAQQPMENTGGWRIFLRDLFASPS